ncbi:HNH homing endonuclease [Staphylococcus phage vB_Sau_Clo6]|nr:HNH homing endonuclease [Staphylococcus phage vB_Sau_Clo6]WLY87082.1 DNA endonuclease [Staphylococcus phage 357Saur119PP]
MKEEWKDIEGYENSYMISNYGRVKAKEKLIKRSNHTMKRKEKILSLNNNGNGYMVVHLYENKKRKSITVHRLVATHFLPNTDNLPCINHKDENKENNRVDNLEWCTQSYNNMYGNRSKKESKTKIENNVGGIPVVGEHRNGIDKIYFKSMMEADRCGFTHQCISSQCTGRKKGYHRDYKWRYATEEEIKLEEK